MQGVHGLLPRRREKREREKDREREREREGAERLVTQTGVQLPAAAVWWGGRKATCTHSFSLSFSSILLQSIFGDN